VQKGGNPKHHGTGNVQYLGRGIGKGTIQRVGISRLEIEMGDPGGFELVKLGASVKKRKKRTALRRKKRRYKVKMFA